MLGTFAEVDLGDGKLDPETVEAAEKLIEEVNEELDDEKVPMVMEWFNRVSQMAFDWHFAEIQKYQKCPVGKDGEPIKPGECIAWGDPNEDEEHERFKVVAISDKDVLFKPWGEDGMFPQSIGLAEVMVHAEPVTVDWALGWFEENVALAETATQREEVYRKAAMYIKNAWRPE